MSTAILSYPRSGNTWVRYIIEFLSKKPTKGYDDKGDRALGLKNNIGVDMKAPPIAYKSHKEILNSADKIIVIVRDYKEAITRHGKESRQIAPDKMKAHFIRETQGKEYRGVDYITVLEAYDNHQADKLLVYYEDLISHPRREIKRICTFMDISDTYMHAFFNDLERHKKMSLKSYAAGSHTKGVNLHFHAANLNKNFVKFMTDHIKNKHPEIYKKYLTRYG